MSCNDILYYHWDISSNQPVSNNQDSSETSNSNDVPSSTGDESVEVLLMVSTPPVVVLSDTSKNSSYTELTFPVNWPRVPPPSDTNVTYSLVPLHYFF